MFLVDVRRHTEDGILCETDISSSFMKPCQTGWQCLCNRVTTSHSIDSPETQKAKINLKLNRTIKYSYLRNWKKRDFVD